MEELNARMTPQEFFEWAAYAELEPFGSLVEDDRWRHHLSLFFSANAKAGTPQPTWLDRDPEETARLASLVTIDDKIETFFAGFATVDASETTSGDDPDK